MPDANPIASLYPAPPQPQTNALASNPLSLVYPMIGLQQLQMQRQQFQASQAAGQAFQGAIGADGSLDTNAAFAALAANPAAALAAPEMTTRLLAARGQQIANATGAANLEVTRNSGLAQFLSGFAGKNLTPKDMNTIRAGAVRFGGDPNTWGAITTPQQAMAAVKNAQVAAAGAATTIQPTPAGPGPNLEPQATTVGAAAQNTPIGGAGGRAVGPSAQDLADNQAFIGDQTKAATTLANLRPLEQALPLVSQLGNFSFGPASNDLAKINGLLTTLGIAGVEPTNALAVRQEVNKKLLQYASGARDAGRSDSALSTAIESNPNLDLTQPANIGLIKNQIGMDKQDAAAPMAAMAAGGWRGYQNFKDRWYQATDPRGFFDYSSPQERYDMGKSLGGDLKDPNSELSRVNRSRLIAKQLGLVGQ